MGCFYLSFGLSRHRCDEPSLWNCCSTSCSFCWLLSWGSYAHSLARKSCCKEMAILIPAVTLRVALGSGIGFLVAQMLDVQIFDRLRSGLWWRAPLASTLIGSAIDTALFFTIAFSSMFNRLEVASIPDWAQGGAPLLGSGPELPLWVSLAVADWLVKLSIALMALVPFRMLVQYLVGRSVKNH